MVIRDGHGRLVLLVHRANADPEEDGGGHHRRKRETEGVVHEVELASSHIEHDGLLRALGFSVLRVQSCAISGCVRCQKS